MNSGLKMWGSMSSESLGKKQPPEIPKAVLMGVI